MLSESSKRIRLGRCKAENNINWRKLMNLIGMLIGLELRWYLCELTTGK